MKNGDFIKATWSDGLEIVGIYEREERGYIILMDDLSKEVPCSKHSVSFQALSKQEGLEFFLKIRKISIIEKVYSFFRKIFSK